MICCMCGICCFTVHQWCCSEIQLLWTVDCLLIRWFSLHQGSNQDTGSEPRLFSQFLVLLWMHRQWPQQGQKRPRQLPPLWFRLWSWWLFFHQLFQFCILPVQRIWKQWTVAPISSDSRCRPFCLLYQWRYIHNPNWLLSYWGWSSEVLLRFHPKPPSPWKRLSLGSWCKWYCKGHKSHHHWSEWASHGVSGRNSHIHSFFRTKQSPLI